MAVTHGPIDLPPRKNSFSPLVFLSLRKKYTPMPTINTKYKIKAKISALNICISFLKVQSSAQVSHKVLNIGNYPLGSQAASVAQLVSRKF